jgi:extracellular matrix regulatory protein B
MYLHLGQNTVIPKSSVIGIFDMDNTTSSHITRKFLNELEKSESIINVADDIPKTFVLCNEMGKTTVYLSQLSSQTLLKRSSINAIES